MKKLRNLILIMMCITLTLTITPQVEEYPIVPLEHLNDNHKND